MKINPAGRKRRRLTWMQLALHTYKFETSYLKLLNEICFKLPTDLVKIIVHYVIYVIYKQNQGQVIFQCLCEPTCVIRHDLITNHTKNKLILLHHSFKLFHKIIL